MVVKCVVSKASELVAGISKYVMSGELSVEDVLLEEGNEGGVQVNRTCRREEVRVPQAVNESRDRAWCLRTNVAETDT